MSLLVDDISELVIRTGSPSGGAVENGRGQTRHGYSVLDLKVRFVVGIAQVVPSTVDLTT
jgi:hypothetical protein